MECWLIGGRAMDSFLIPSASGAVSLEFFERTPPDTRQPIERFKVRLVGPELSAVGRIYVDTAVYSVGAASHPVSMFTQMAANWRGWEDELAWGSPEEELTLSCAQDRTGHVSIKVELRSGSTEQDWTVRATVMTEAGQLEEVARHAALFFGLDYRRTTLSR